MAASSVVAAGTPGVGAARDGGGGAGSVTGASAASVKRAWLQALRNTRGNDYRPVLDIIRGIANPAERAASARDLAAAAKTYKHHALAATAEELAAQAAAAR